MKVVILAGGLGTRISEETDAKPKPMVTIGGKPILWHIMKYYSNFGLNEFIICCGYKGNVIKEYFANYFLHSSDITFNLKDNNFHVHQKRSEDWVVSLVDTGESTMTGGRIKRIGSYLDDEDFCLTYGDGLADLDLSQLLKFHKGHKGMATLTAVYPPGRFGVLKIDEHRVSSFHEKPSGTGSRINGGFFVLSPRVIDYIDGDETIWEQSPLNRLVEDKQLYAFPHDGFWQPMDTLRDRKYLESLWSANKAPWKIWEAS